MTRHVRLTHQSETFNFPNQSSDLDSANSSIILNWSLTSSDVGVQPSFQETPGTSTQVPDCIELSQPTHGVQPDVRSSSQILLEDLNGVDPEQTHDTSFSGETINYDYDPSLESCHFDPFAQDFGMFMDSVPSQAHPFSLTHQPLPAIYSTPGSPSIFMVDIATKGPSLTLPQPGYTAVVAPFGPSSVSEAPTVQSSLSRYCSRLPSLEPEARSTPGRRPEDQTEPRQHSGQLFVSSECRQSVLEELATFVGCIDSNFVLPSRHALSRLVAGYFQNFHDHYPFFHVPTLKLDSIHAELLLAITALGARYTMEPELGVELYRVARSVALERISRHQTFASAGESGETQKKDQTSFVMQMMQTLLLLIAVSSWYKHEPAAADALSIRSILHSIVRENSRSGSASTNASASDDWMSWIHLETLKRTYLVIFCFFNLHTILFDLPPMMLTNEANFELPCSEKEWRASSEQAWREARAESGTDRRDFKEAYSSLFTNKHQHQPTCPQPKVSALGCYGLIHAVIQQIWLVRNGRMPVVEGGIEDNSLSKEEMKIFERALKRWTNFWELNKESSMDPLNPHGPLTFTSTALLRLAYIRLNMNFGPTRSLNSWDPQQVAHSLHQSPKARRGDQMTRAALHCAHALSIPVKLGINYVARTQMIHWSNQHALCSLECAVLLAKWLDSVTALSLTDVTAAEQRVLDFTMQLVAEDKYKASYESILEQKHRLSAMVVRLWAKLYQSRSVWQTVNLIGESLSIYAELLEKDRV